MRAAESPEGPDIMARRSLSSTRKSSPCPSKDKVQSVKRQYQPCTWWIARWTWPQSFSQFTSCLLHLLDDVLSLSRSLDGCTFYQHSQQAGGRVRLLLRCAECCLLLAFGVLPDLIFAGSILITGTSRRGRRCLLVLQVSAGTPRCCRRSRSNMSPKCTCCLARCTLS